MNAIGQHRFSALGIAVIVVLTVPSLASGQVNPYAPVPQSSLQEMLTINWQLGPDLPRGLQAPGLGIVDGSLVVTSGFTLGQTDVPGKATKYPNGWNNNTWSLDLQSPQSGWQNQPNRPGLARQGLISAVVNDQLYTWGGFNFDNPYAYADGALLSFSGGQATWSTPLPDLPWNLYSAGTAVIGSKIYLFGGADFDLNSQTTTWHFYTEDDRDGNVPRLGARTLMIDTDNLAAGWTELAQLPGTPRFNHATATVDGKVYMFGGATGQDNSLGVISTVVDNWEYDPATDSWTRLQDLPVSSGNFPSGDIVAFDRYILLTGGYQYNQVMRPDGIPSSRYGTAFQDDSGYANYSDMFVYDTLLGKFGTATPFPLNNNIPIVAVDGDTIYLVGGEVDGPTSGPTPEFFGTYVNGVPFGHNPDLLLTGTLQAAPLPSTIEWGNTSSGNWDDQTNWLPGNVPGENFQTAIFGSAITTPKTVFTNSAITVKEIQFGVTSDGGLTQSYAISGPGSINLNSDSAVSTITVIDGSHQFQTQVNLQNATSVSVASGATLTFNNALDFGGYTLTKTGSGTMNINNSLNTGGGAVELVAGVLGGAGDVIGDVTNSGGIIAPGNSPGELSIVGNYIQQAGASLAIEINGNLSETEYDVLSVSGNMIIMGGTLDIVMGFTPAPGDVFDVFNFSLATGAFDAINGTPGENLVWDTSRLFVDGTLVVLSAASVPEPESACLMVMALGALVLCGVRRTMICAYE